MQVSKMTEEQAKEKLQEIIDKLDELSGEDYFGTEGWKEFMDIEL